MAWPGLGKYTAYPRPGQDSPPLGVRWFSEGLGPSEYHRLEHVDVCGDIAKLDVERLGRLVVPEHMQCDAGELKPRDLGFKSLEGAKGVAAASVLWSHVDVVDVCDVAIRSVFGDEPEGANRVAFEAEDRVEVIVLSVFAARK